MRPFLLGLALLFACRTGGPLDSHTGGDADTDSDSDVDNDALDIRAMDLTLDLTGPSGVARLVIAETYDDVVRLEAGGLTVHSVTDAEGIPLDYEHTGDTLDVTVSGEPPWTVDVTYDFAEGDWGLLSSGSTLTWPTDCGLLFPCHSSPQDGLTWKLAITGQPEAFQVVYGPEIVSEAPAYQLAWATASFGTQTLGTTSAGTTVHVWWRTEEGSATALAGTQHLVEVFDWYEQELGPYPFGDDVGSVSVDWGEGGFGGMEHHPYWHVGSPDMGTELVHAHEAAHGWFGDGVRIACWEDLVLSEGFATYLAARALSAADPFQEEEIWSEYRDELEWVVSYMDAVALPDDTCNERDPWDLLTLIPYQKGAFFLKALETAVGREAFDAAVASFYQGRVGTAARMQDFLDHLAAETAFDPGDLADAWLRSHGIPE